MSHDRKMITAIFCIENKNLLAWWSPTGKPVAPLVSPIRFANGGA